MRRISLRLTCGFCWVLFMGWGSGAPRAVAAEADAAPDELAARSDEFDDATSAGRWHHVFREEGSPANQLELFDINTSAPGCLAMMPFTSTWYRDYRGVLVYKPVQGDFAITTRLFVTGRNRRTPPQVPFSLAGLLVRAPRDVTPETWQPGGENYVFISLGSAQKTGRYEFEMKTTHDSDSQLATTDASDAQALLQIARIGPHFILLTRSAEGPWTVRARYYRPDLPDALQAGLTSYTDWPHCEVLQPQQHNLTVIRDGQPDLFALFDWVHYRRVQPPAELKERALSDPREVSDADLVGFLGENVAG